MSKSVFTDKFYTHFDSKKHFQDYVRCVKNVNWVKHHGFFPFIHFVLKFNKYARNEKGEKKLKVKKRDLYYAAHIDRFIYQYYGNRLNEKYNQYVKLHGINNASIAYRNCKPGKSNIHFAKEVFEFIVKSKTAYIFIADFSNFFDSLNHEYLKRQLLKVNKECRLDDADYAIFKNLTHFTYIEESDIEKYKCNLKRDMRGLEKYFETKEFQRFKSKYLKKHAEDYGIPQGTSISAVYANVYMVDFDKKLNDFVTSRSGIYRRYCDDIIIVVPMTKRDIEDRQYEAINRFIFETQNSIPNLNLNVDKTEQFCFLNEHIEGITSDKRNIDYLGFSFDGKIVKIREKSLFKFYCRAYKKVKKIKNAKDAKGVIAGKKAVYQAYTHLGSHMYSRKHGNFISYAYKSQMIFDDSEYLKCDIRKQVKGHWKKINKKLKEG